jgi:ribonuclease D
MMGIFRRLFAWIFKPRDNGGRSRPAVWPTREEILSLPTFQGLGLDDIVVVDTPEKARRARQELSTENIVGFDTESKPTFRKGEVSTGPHVVQFSTSGRAYLFLLHDQESRKIAGELIASPALKKVGFGLIDDLRQIRIKLGVEPQSVIELQTLFAQAGLGRGVGAKTGVAMALKRRLLKSKKIGTSDWSYRRLNERQQLYAANDAFAAVSVFHALKPPEDRRGGFTPTLLPAE